MKRFILVILLTMTIYVAQAQKFRAPDTTSVASAGAFDTTITLPDVTYATFRSKDDQMEYYKTISRIQVVLPYVKIARKLYNDLKNQKESDNKRAYRHYRKDLEHEMRDKFEKELKNLSVGQGKVMVKLINRETGNNCYGIIKEVKGGFNAWTWQIVARHYDYNLKETYDPHKEWILELAIKALGSEYNPN